MIRYVKETGSTNTDLLEALRSTVPFPQGDWLVADRQTSGRGRQGRTWFDGSGNFMGSTVVRLLQGDPAPASLALVAGLAVYAAIVPFLPEPAALKLKWPNDLLLGEAKLAGILLEREGDAIVAGVGVNLTVAPALPDRKSIALADIGLIPGRDRFAVSLADTFAVELHRWRTFGLEPIVRRWQEVAHPVGTRLTVMPPGEGALVGEFVGLSPDGALLLRLADGATRVIHAGDVMLAQPEN